MPIIHCKDQGDSIHVDYTYNAVASLNPDTALQQLAATDGISEARIDRDTVTLSFTMSKHVNPQALQEALVATGAMEGFHAERITYELT